MTSSTENKNFFVLPDVGGDIAEIDKSNKTDVQKLKLKMKF